jgi:hypothetical protein
VPLLNPYTAEGMGANFGLYPEDGYGVDSNGDIQVTFSTPMRAIGASGGSSVWNYWLYSGDTMVWDGPLWNPALGKFYGITTSFTFDRVVMHIGTNFELALDNVYFSTVPGPGSLAVLAAGAMLRRRRTR